MKLLSLLCVLFTAFVLPALAQDTPPPDHGEELPAALRITPAQIADAVQKGQEYAKKNGTYVGMLDKYRQNPVWMRGEGGKSHESYVRVLNLNGITISALAFQSARKYETLQLPERFKAKGGYNNDIRFEVFLKSIPHIARNRFQKERSADEQDVTVVQFVLSDDQGHNFDATSNEGSQSSGTVDLPRLAAVVRASICSVENGVIWSARCVGTGMRSVGETSSPSSSTIQRNRVRMVAWYVCTVEGFTDWLSRGLPHLPPGMDFLSER